MRIQEAMFQGRDLELVKLANMVLYEIIKAISNQYNVD